VHPATGNGMSGRSTDCRTHTTNQPSRSVGAWMGRGPRESPPPRGWTTANILQTLEVFLYRPCSGAGQQRLRLGVPPFHVPPIDRAGAVRASAACTPTARVTSPYGALGTASVGGCQPPYTLAPPPRVSLVTLPAVQPQRTLVHEAQAQPEREPGHDHAAVRAEGRRVAAGRPGQLRGAAQRLRRVLHRRAPGPLLPRPCILWTPRAPPRRMPPLTVVSGPFTRREVESAAALWHAVGAQGGVCRAQLQQRICSACLCLLPWP